MSKEMSLTEIPLDLIFIIQETIQSRVTSSKKHISKIS